MEMVHTYTNHCSPYSFKNKSAVSKILSYELKVVMCVSVKS